MLKLFMVSYLFDNWIQVTQNYYTGIYIMENTMVRGGGKWPAGGKNKYQELGKKNEKGKRKKEENYIKNGEKGLK